MCYVLYEKNNELLNFGILPTRTYNGVGACIAVFDGLRIILHIQRCSWSNGAVSSGRGRKRKRHELVYRE